MKAPQTPQELREALTQTPESIIDEQAVEAQSLAQEDEPPAASASGS